MWDNFDTNSRIMRVILAHLQSSTFISIQHRYLRCGMQKVQDKMLAEVQGWCRDPECRGGAGAVQVVQGGYRGGSGGAGGMQATCTVCTSASIISGEGRCRGCRHTSGLVHLLHICPSLIFLAILHRPQSSALCCLLF